MTINYLPSEMISKFSSDKRIKKIIGNNFKLNKAVIKMITSSGVVSKKKLTDVALKVLKEYKKKYSTLRDDDLSVKEAKNLAFNDKSNLVNRVKNLTAQEITKEIKDKYYGEKYIWLPSNAENPDPEHQLLYGQVFTVGVGEMPQDRYGCQCGMELLVKENELDI